MWLIVGGCGPQYGGGACTLAVIIDNRVNIYAVIMSSKLVKTPLGLYKHLLRQLALLPEPVRPHYKHRIRQVPLHIYIYNKE